MAVRDVFLTLDGRELRLRFDLGAWAALEDRGYTLDALLEQFREGKLNVRGTLSLLWAALQINTPPPSVADVGHLVDGHNFEAVVERLGHALRVAFPDAPAESPSGDAPRPFAEPGTGPRPDASAPA